MACVGHSLGCSWARGLVALIRLCAFDIRNEKSHCMLRHDYLEDMHGM
jgi:hypothetical protein